MELALGCFAVVILANTGLVMFYYWSSFDDPMASRFSLPWLLLMIFAFIVLRGLIVSSRNEDPFCRFATAGLVMLFGVQSAINMAVNLKLAPAKGMTLPFISYGGSSALAMAICVGMLLSLTRDQAGMREMV